MKKIIGVGIAVCLMIGSCLIILTVGSKIKGIKSSDKEEGLTNILTDSSVIDLGSHIIAYRASSDRMNSGIEEGCIAIQALDTDYDSILYLPDIYDEVYNLRMEGLNSLHISYGNADDGSVHSVHIPLLFPSQADYEIVEWGGDRFFIEGKKDIEKKTAELPKTVWSESVIWKEKEYLVKFERTSLIYEIEYGENGALYADYCLKTEDKEGNVLAQQTIINYPVAYEEAYWMLDFSGDGFLDIVFCTEYNAMEEDSGEKNLATLYIMICNTRNEKYESRQLPVYGLRTSMPVWNEQYSVISLYCEDFLRMYAFHNRKWTNIKEEYDNVVTGEENVHNIDNIGNVALYPDAEWWETVEITAGDEIVSKYVRRIKNEESK